MILRYNEGVKPRSALSILFFLCLFPAFLTAQNVNDIMADKFEETEGTGLEINTNPSLVEIYIDGVYRGFTPNFFNLPPGSHNIRLTKEGYKERQFNVVLFNTSKLVVSIKMEEDRGYASVSVHRTEDSPEELPLNPHISIASQIGTGLSDEGASASSLSDNGAILISLPVGYRTIRVRAFGWEDASVTVLISEHDTTNVDIYMKPAEFKLSNGSQSRKRFNPKNSGNLGINEYRFEVSAPGEGTFTIQDRNGLTVYERQLERFDTWLQSVTWDGSDNMLADDEGSPVPEGIYTVIIEASADIYSEEPAGLALLKFETEINYSANIFPLSISGGIGGLSFAPLPFTLPAGSFQIESGIFFKSAESWETVSFSLPFEIGIRVSPVNKLEITSAFNINPRFKDSTGWGITGSLKYNILGGGNIPLGLAAGVSYSWASGKSNQWLGESPLSPGRGIGFYAPLSLKIEKFSPVISPGIFWRGPDGSAPALLISAGLLYRGEWFNAGASMRCEFDFGKNNSAFTQILAGVEARFYPPPSNLFFTVQAGMKYDSGAGGYGGIGIGIVY